MTIDQVIEAHVEEHGWKPSKIAGILGVDRRTLYRWFKKYNIKQPENA